MPWRTASRRAPSPAPNSSRSRTRPSASCWAAIDEGRPMRFQDAAKDARAVVYAGIQADPLVARAAGLLAGASVAQRVLARAVMNGETTDADGWRATFPTLFGAEADPDGRERSEAILVASRRDQ